MAKTRSLGPFWVKKGPILALFGQKPGLSGLFGFLGFYPKNPLFGLCIKKWGCGLGSFGPQDPFGAIFGHFLVFLAKNVPKTPSLAPFWVFGFLEILFSFFDQKPRLSALFGVLGYGHFDPRPHPRFLEFRSFWPKRDDWSLVSEKWGWGLGSGVLGLKKGPMLWGRVF